MRDSVLQTFHRGFALDPPGVLSSTTHSTRLSGAAPHHVNPLHCKIPGTPMVLSGHFRHSLLFGGWDPCSLKDHTHADTMQTCRRASLACRNKYDQARQSKLRERLM